MRLVYAVHLDGGLYADDPEISVHADAATALALAVELKQANPDELVSIVLWPA